MLIGSGALAVTAAAMGGAGRWISSYRTRLVNIALPAAAAPIPPLPTGLDAKVPGISSFQTSRDAFYRVDTRLTLPIVDVNSWTLTIDGDVDKEVTFTFDDLMAMELIERDITLTCVSNDIGGKYVGSARWLGVRLMDLLEMAGISNTKADQMLSTDVDGMTIGTPFDLATDGRDAMIAIGMNGKSLPIEHGFPARMVIPGLYGFISATKWISKITLTTYAETDSYWTERDWDIRTPIKISSRIDTPRPLSRIDAGRTAIGGVAWAQHQGGIAKVQVRVDGGAWQDARLGPTAGEDYWRQWYLPWTAEPGQHMLAVRAFNGEGEEQTAARATPFPERLQRHPGSRRHRRLRPPARPPNASQRRPGGVSRPGSCRLRRTAAPSRSNSAETIGKTSRNSRIPNPAWAWRRTTGVRNNYPEGSTP